MSASALAIDEERVKSLNELQNPQNGTKLRLVLGLCHLYGRFVPNYTDIAAH